MVPQGEKKGLYLMYLYFQKLVFCEKTKNSDEPARSRT